MKTNNHTKSSSKKTQVVSKKVPSNNINYQASGVLGFPISRTFTSSLSGNSRELVVAATDFADYTAAAGKPVLQYCFRDRQTLFASSGLGGVDAIARVQSVEVWALPRAVNAAVASNTLVALYSTPVVVGDDGISEGRYRLTSQRNTVLRPTFNVNWVKVGHTDFRKLYNDAIVLPAYVVENDETTGVNLFSLSFIDPDNKSAVTTPVQLMIKITYAATLPVDASTQIGSEYVADFATMPKVSYGGQYTMLNLKLLSNRT